MSLQARDPLLEVTQCGPRLSALGLTAEYVAMHTQDLWNGDDDAVAGAMTANGDGLSEQGQLGLP
jgi:hypothetical protein